MRKPIIIAVLSLSGFISSQVWGDEIALQDNPPQEYVVVKGDTLWGISSRFLKDPWRWPELWQMNRAQIKNPHLIYPGDMVILDTSGISPHLRLVKGDQTIKLSPRVRSETMAAQAIPAIPPSAIGPFLTQALIVEDDELDHSPYVVGPEDDRVIMGRGDRIFVTHDLNGNTLDESIRDWSIYRKGKALFDPDTKEPLGNETEHIGDARVVQHGEVMTMEITNSVYEIRREDRLVPSSSKRTFQYVPHSPEKSINGRIISAYGAVSDAGRYQTVVINKGSRDGLEEGHVLAVYRKGRTAEPLPGEPLKKAWRYMDRECIKAGKTIAFDQFYDPKEELEPCQKEDGTAAIGDEIRYSDIGCLKPGAKVSFDQFFNPKEVYKLHCRGEKRDTVTLPDTRTGLVFVYRVFDRASYALVMSSSRPVYLLDVVKNP